MRSHQSLRLRFSGRWVAAAMLCLATCALPQASQQSNQPQSRTDRVAADSKSRNRGAHSSAVSFADVTRAAGIDFHLTCGSPEKRYIMESMCGGMAVFDYDNDGWMDILLVNGSTLEDLKAGKCHPSKLYRNNHDGSFTDVTTKAGLAHFGRGFGAAG